MIPKTIVMENFFCFRCLHEWFPRRNPSHGLEYPERCPKCHSKYWKQEQRPKVRGLRARDEREAIEAEERALMARIAEAAKEGVSAREVCKQVVAEQKAEQAAPTPAPQTPTVSPVSDVLPAPEMPKAEPIGEKVV